MRIFSLLKMNERQASLRIVSISKIRKLAFYRWQVAIEQTVRKCSEISSFLGKQFLFVGLIGCQTGNPPILEYTMARTAIQAAQKANAEQLAPGYWTRTQQFYQKGQMHYNKKEYRLSSEAFRQTYLYAEKAENVARIKKMKSGNPF